MRPQIVVLRGNSGSGKTALIDAAVRKLHTLQKVKSLTTRNRRGPEDDETYDFVSWIGFALLWLRGKIVQWDVFHRNVYGNTAKQFTSISRLGRVGILAMTNAGVKNLKRFGFNVRVVQVIAIGAKARPGREGADAAKTNAADANFVLENRFEEGGFEQAVDELVRYIDWEFD